MTELDSNRKTTNKSIYLLPNLFTIAAMFSGFYAIISAMKGQFEQAAIAILLACVFDSLDGRVARLLNAASEFGAQLDSLADMMSFGVAPALVLYCWSLSHIGKIGWLAAFIYAVCTALRLARFNVTDVDEKRYFFGVPTPVAAAFVAAAVWASTGYGINGEDIAPVVVIMAIGLGVLKVSRIKYRSFKDLDLSGKVPFMVIVAIVLVIAIIWLDPPDILLCIASIYLLSGPVVKLFGLRKKSIKAEIKKEVKKFKDDVLHHDEKSDDKDDNNKD